MMDKLTEGLQFLAGVLSGLVLAALAFGFKRFLGKGFERLLNWLPLSMFYWYRYWRWEKKYKSVMLEEHRYLKFVGIRHTIPLNQPKLRDVFVNLEMQTGGEVLKSSESRSIGLGETYTLDAALSRFNRLAVLGHPGSGKTTLLENLACICCEKKRPLSRLLPIYVPLRRCSSERETIVQQLINPNIGLLPIPLLQGYPKGFFGKRMSQGRCLFLFDGLDEVLSEDDHVAAARLIENTSAAFPECTIIVSSRLAGWRNLLSNKFIRLAIRELSRHDINGLVKRWYRSVVYEDIRSTAGSTLSPQQENHARSIASEKSGEILYILNSNPRLMQIASTPLILSLMCLVYYTQQNLPKRRAELYEECSAILLEEWDSLDKQLHHQNIPPLTQKVKLLEQVAIFCFEQSASELRKNDLLSIIANFLTGNNINLSASEALRFVEERSGIISEKARDVYSFTHLTFQEYFAAQGLKNLEDGFDRLMQRFKKADIHEVLLLYCGVSTNSDRIIETLLEEYERSNSTRFLEAAGKATCESQKMGVKTRVRVIDTLCDTFDRTNDAQLMENLQKILLELGVEKAIVRNFGDFEVGEEIGRGGNGTVYMARDKSSGEKVALKVLNFFNESVIESIQGAIRQVRGLTHPNLVQMRHFGKADNQFFISMEYIEGCTLDILTDKMRSPHTLTHTMILQDMPSHEWMRFRNKPLIWKDPLHLEWVTRVIREICESTNYLHSKNLIHGDIKPGNISWTGTKSVLLDFGIDRLLSKAKAGMQTFDPTRPALISSGVFPAFGTPSFMSPEQATGGTIDSRTDIYSIGSTIYFLLTGKSMYSSSSMVATLAATLNEPTPRIIDHLPEAVQLDEIFRKMVEKDPRDRPQSLEIVINELDRL